MKVLRPFAALVLSWAAFTASMPVAVAQHDATPLWQERPRTPRNHPGPSLDELVKRARPAVVQVRGRAAGQGKRHHDRQRLSVGTGFFIAPSGALITNEHVVRGVSDLRVRLADGRELPACVMGVDAPTDIALLRANPGLPVPVLQFGDSGGIGVGEPAIVIGNPFGFDHSVTVGVISAKERVIDRGNVDATTSSASVPYSFYLQTDAAINLGNSGGPLLDRQGAVVGVAAAFWGSNQPAHGIGFAIPIDIVKRLLPQLHETGTVARSFLGIDSQPLDPMLVEAFDLGQMRGALIAHVNGNAAAAQAELQPGDIVLSWDGEDVAGVEDFKIYAQLTQPGKPVRVRYLRAGKPQQTTVTTQPLITRRTDSHPAQCREKTSYEQMPLGLELKTVRRAGAGDRVGIVVASVKDGAGREAGLFPGDLLLQVGARPITGPTEFLRLLNTGQAGRPMPVLVRRDGFDFWVAIPVR